MAKNLGMRPDFKRTDSNGNNCYGYMDNEDDTNYWSTCSVEDFTAAQKGCLKTANNRDDDYSAYNSNDNGKAFIITMIQRFLKQVINDDKMETFLRNT